VKISKVDSTRCDPHIVIAEKRLRSTQGIFDWLPQNRTQQKCKQTITYHIEKPHRTLIHRVDKARTVYKLAMSIDHEFIELWQVLGRHAEICIENHEHIATGLCAP